MAQERSILVTGCSSGIGAWCARALKSDGWRVFATARKPDDIEALENDGLEALYLDYASPQSIADAVGKVLDLTGNRLDALFNNGAYSQVGAVEDLPVEALREQFDANFFGWHDLTRRVIPVMRQQGRGRIVQCSSILGLMPMRYRGAYSASKGAIEALSIAMRYELDGSGVHVSLIEPGPIESRIAVNALPYVSRYIDIDASVHRKDYEAQLQRLRQGGVKNRAKLKPDAIYRVLRHALENPRPKPHYIVTTPAKTGVILKRLLPARLFHAVLKSRS